MYIAVGITKFSMVHIYVIAYNIHNIGIENAKDIMPSSGMRDAKNHQYADKTNESEEGMSRKNSKFMDLNKVPFIYSY